MIAEKIYNYSRFMISVKRNPRTKSKMERMKVVPEPVSGTM